jgi:FkbM family methyltransferase
MMKLKIQDYYIRFHSTSSLSIEFWFNPASRKSDYDFITSYLRCNDVYVDLGANIGTTLIPAMKITVVGKVIGVEPHPKIFSYLQENIRLNNPVKNVELHNCAVGDNPGYTVISNKRRDDTNSVDCQGEGIRVTEVLLDDIIADRYRRINLLKIDVEGFEKFVCKGGTRTLARTDCVYLEVCEQGFNRFGYTTKDLLIVLEKMGFELFRKHQLENNTIVPIDSNYMSTRHHENIFAIRDVEEFITRTKYHVWTSNASKV